MQNLFLKVRAPLVLLEVSPLGKEGSIYSCGHSHTSLGVPHSSIFQKCWAVKLIVSSKPWSSEVRYLIMLLSRVMAKLHSTSKTELTTALEINSHTPAWCAVQTTHDFVLGPVFAVLASQFLWNHFPQVQAAQFPEFNSFLLKPLSCQWNLL